MDPSLGPRDVCLALGVEVLARRGPQEEQVVDGRSERVAQLVAHHGGELPQCGQALAAHELLLGGEELGCALDDDLLGMALAPGEQLEDEGESEGHDEPDTQGDPRGCVGVGPCQRLLLRGGDEPADGPEPQDHGGHRCRERFGTVRAHEQLSRITVGRGVDVHVDVEIRAARVGHRSVGVDVGRLQADDVRIRRGYGRQREERVRPFVEDRRRECGRSARELSADRGDGRPWPLCISRPTASRTVGVGVEMSTRAIEVPAGAAGVFVCCANTWGDRPELTVK